MTTDNGIAKHFGDNLARLLSSKIIAVYPKFDADSYIKSIKKECKDLGYSARLELHADKLKEYLPESYSDSMEILVKIMGKENPNETGMFKEFYWLMPVGKYIEKFGLKNFTTSIKAIEELTKRNTGEYAIRTYLQNYPDRTIKIMKKWALSDNFHLRRLATEGLRPKLPWAKKLEVFIDQPQPVFEILTLLKEEEIKFVKKSVANNLADYLKVNPEPTIRLLKKWQKSKNIHTQWMIQHATRKFKTILN